MSQPSHLRLHYISDREHGLRKLLLGQLTEEIALVLVGVASREDPMYRSFRPLDRLLAAVMAGSDIISPQLLCAFEECIELYLPVAEHVRIGRTAFLILVEHVVHNSLAVFLAQIHEIKRNAYLARHKLSHKPVLLPLAVAVERSRSIMPVLHEQSEDIVTLLLQQKSRNTRIDTSRKSYAYLNLSVIRHRMRYFQ